MIKTAIILDLVSGIFFAIDFLFPASVGRRIGMWLVSQLPEKGKENDPLSKRTLRFNIIVAGLAIIGIVIWAMVVDPKSYSVGQIIKSASLYSLGLVLGIIFCVLIPLILGKLPKIIRPKPGNGIIGSTWIIALIITFVILLALRYLAANVNILAPALIFIITILVLVMVMMSTQYIRKYVDATPKKRVYAISRIGLVLFIVSKVIELKQVF